MPLAKTGTRDEGAIFFSFSLGHERDRSGYTNIRWGYGGEYAGFSGVSGFYLGQFPGFLMRIFTITEFGDTGSAVDDRVPMSNPLVLVFFWVYLDFSVPT